MTRDSAKEEYEVIADLGRKVGIPDLSMEDFDLVFAAADGVDTYCDQFETIEFTSKERFHFMQLIVASLDRALEKRAPGWETNEKRVEQLLLKDLGAYKYIIDYWGRTDCELHTAPMMARLKSDSRYLYTSGEAPFEESPR
jgi:hypothetical protein